MDEYGLFVSNENSLSELTSGCRTINYLGFFSVRTYFDSNGYWVTGLGSNYIKGSDVIVVFSRMGGFFSRTQQFYMVGRVDINKGDGLLGIQISGQWNTTYSFSEDQIQFKAYQVTLPSTDPDDYIFQLANSSNFLEIDSNRAVSGMVYKGSVVANGSWSVPQNIINQYPDCVAFVSWQHPEARMVGGQQSGSFWYRISGNTPVQYTGSIVVDMCVFSDSLNLSMPENGLSLFNSSGLCTFSSEKPPISIAGYINMGGSLNTPISPPENVDRIMVNAGIYGLDTWNRGDGWYRSFYCGLIMQGKTVIVSGANGTGGDYNTAAMQPFILNAQIPYIDRSKYFNN